MHRLTLDEKISIKGALSRYRGCSRLAALSMPDALCLWYAVFYRPISQYYIANTLTGKSDKRGRTC